MTKSFSSRASAEKFPGGGRATEKIPKNSKKRPKIALLSLYYIFTMYENPGGHGIPAPAADAHVSHAQIYAE